MTTDSEVPRRSKFDPYHAVQISEFEKRKKAKEPKLGNAFGYWAGTDASTFQLPGGAILTFDLSQLTLQDFRQMRWHPQVNISLSILNFMFHQLTWRIVPVNESTKRAQKIADEAEQNIKKIWNQMVGALNQAFWAGYAPTVIEWGNNPITGRVEITRFKDLVPEDCLVNWKVVEGWAPPGRSKPKFKEYDGIIQVSGAGWPIPAENTLWYALLSENGDYYGRKLLRPAFTPWYFSTLVHLFANRYYERFGEPTPIGRAPYDSEVETAGGETITGRAAIEQVMSNLRSRGVVTLPSDRDPVTKEFDYTLEYLESQMRGPDFERYLARLDEEISMGMFTPMLLFRSGNVGSNSLGVQHTTTFLWMLNGVYGDIKYHIDNYVLKPWKNLNYGERAPEIEWQFRNMGRDNQQTVRAIINALISKNKAEVNLEELGDALGMTVSEVKQMTDSPGTGDAAAQVPGQDTRVRDDKKAGPQVQGNGEIVTTGEKISARLAAQLESAWRKGEFSEGFKPSLGYERQMQDALVLSGLTPAEAKRNSDLFYARLGYAIEDLATLGQGEFSSSGEVVALANQHITMALEGIV